RVILYMVYGFGAVLAVFGNLLVMSAILHFKQLHSPTNFLIASLACADFLVGVTVMPFSMVRSVESCWYFGRTFCTFHTCFDTAFCYSSLFHLSFISIDRYIAVTDPLVYPTKFTVSVSCICISISWILPITYSGAVFYTGANENGLEELSHALNCAGGCQMVVNQNWVLIDFLSFFIPTLVMIILYSNIFLVARQQAKKIENTGSKTDSIFLVARQQAKKIENTGANAAGLEDLVSALTCVGGCQIAVNQSWVLVSFLVFFIPTLVMITVYFKIFLIAKQQARKIESLNNKTGRCSDSFQDRVAKRERKAARTLGVAVLAFLVSWLPYFLDSIIDAFLGFITPTYIYEILVWIAYYNSAMNPLIYAFFYPWFRKAIKLIVTGKVLR
ncbi:Trace amine-associated receptor 6, partial [Bos mutus]